MEDIHHECAIGGVSLKNPGRKFYRDELKLVPSALMIMAHELQPRGQKSSGISTYNPFRTRIIRTHKEVGKVAEVFRFADEKEQAKLISEYAGTSGLFNNRYSTSGDSNRDDREAGTSEAQPFDIRHFNRDKRFSVGLNGTIVNNEELRKDLKKQHNYAFDTKVDTETIAALISLKLKELADFREIKDATRFEGVFRHLHNSLDGAYNLVTQFGTGELAAYRDSRGFHPLVYGETDRFAAVASESIALEAIGIEKFRDILPGELLIINQKGTSSVNIAAPNLSECEMEFVYFMRGNSMAHGESVRDKRVRLGRELAKDDPLREKIKANPEKYVVIPAPWTGVASAEGYSEEAGVKWRLGLGKKTLDRAFISGVLARRLLFGRNYDSYPSAYGGLRVIITDDSIVRGDTSKRLVKEVWEGGAEEVHLRITKPRIIAPCFYGIDFSTLKELFANKFKDDEAGAKELGVTSLVFQTLEGLLSGLGRERKDLCLACINAEYPTPAGQRRYNQLVKN